MATPTFASITDRSKLSVRGVRYDPYQMQASAQRLRDAISAPHSARTDHTASAPEYALGAPAAAEMTLFGHVYDLADAHRLRIVNHIVPAERLIDEAVAWAGRVEPGCHAAYGYSKRALQASTLRAIDEARRLDQDLLARHMTELGGLRAHARRYRELKGREPSWEVPERS